MSALAKVLMGEYDNGMVTVMLFSIYNGCAYIHWTGLDSCDLMQKA